MMDGLVRQHFKEKYFDENATIALKGKINTALLEVLKENNFFKQPFPKTTGPELFNLEYLQQAKQKSSTTAISIEDTMATLNKFSADTIVEALLKTTDKNKPYKIFNSAVVEKEKFGRASFKCSINSGLCMPPPLVNKIGRAHV